MLISCRQIVTQFLSGNAPVLSGDTHRASEMALSLLHTLSKEELFAFGESKQINWEQKLYIYVLIILQPLTAHRAEFFFYEKQSKSRLKVVTCVQFRPIIFFKVLPPNKPRICNLHAILGWLIRFGTQYYTATSTWKITRIEHELRRKS